MVNLVITGGPTFSVGYTKNMNVQQVLEAAYNSVPPSTFTFSLQYYGTKLGYLVAMVNETYESFNSKEAPFFFWELLVDGQASPTGIDNTAVKDGSTVTFSFVTYSASIPPESTMHAKYKARVGA